MLARFKQSAFMASLGLTKQDATNAFIGCATRRVYVTFYEEAENFEGISDELKRFLGDKDYRLMLCQVGKKVRKNIFGNANVFDAFAGMADEHSMGLRTFRDKLDYGELDSFELDDDIVDGFIADGIKVISDYVETGLGTTQSNEPTPMEAASDENENIILTSFRNLGQHMSVTDLFPDIGEYLTDVDPQRPWLPRDPV